MDKYSFSLYTHPTLKVQNADYNQYKVKANWKLSAIKKIARQIWWPQNQGAPGPRPNWPML